MSIMKAENLGKIYEGKVYCTALTDINFEIEAGEFIAIMGPIPTAVSCTAALIVIQAIFWLGVRAAYKKALFNQVYGEI